MSSIGPPGISLFTAHTVYIITTPNWSHVGAFLFLSVCMCERSIMGRVQQIQQISTVERKLKKREQKTKGSVDWFKRWLIDLQVTANVKGPSYGPSLPPTRPAIFALLLCLSVPVLSEKSFTFSLFVLLRLFSYHHSALPPSPPLQLEQLVSPPLWSQQPHPLNSLIALPHSRHHLFTPA